MASRSCPVTDLSCERGQAALLLLGLLAAVLAGAVVLFAFGNALGAKGRNQRAIDLAAISAAQVMRDLYPRLFEPPFIEPDVPNPRHLEEGEYRAAAVAAAIRGGRRNGVPVRAEDVSFPESGFAPTRVTVEVRGEARVSLGGEGGRAESRVPIRARAFDRMAAAARDEAGLFVSITGGFRSDAEQARLFAAHPTPHLLCRSGWATYGWATRAG